MNTRWQAIWNKKQLDLTIDSTLAQLIEVDGFSSPFGGLTQVEDWQAYVEQMSDQLNITTADSIFEIGCGAGAFLYPFYLKGHRVAGIDYAEGLVQIANKVMPQADIQTSEAIALHQQNNWQPFDIVVANSLFFYFPDYEYAQTVLSIMLKMATKSIGILDVPDLAKQEEALCYRRGQMGALAYEQHITSTSVEAGSAMY